MNAYLMLLLEMLISLAVSMAVLRALSQPLIQTLVKICPDDESAGFWLSYTRIMLVIAPLILVLLMDLFARYGNPLDSLRMALLAALGGLLMGLHLIGSKLGRFVAYPELPEITGGAK